MNGSTDRPGGAQPPAPLVQDETITELTLLDVLDLDLDGALRLNESFCDEVERESRAEEDHRHALGYQGASNPSPAIRGALRARANARGQRELDVERLVHALRRLFPDAW